MTPSHGIRRATVADAPTLAALNGIVHMPHVEAHPRYFRPTETEALAALFAEWLDQDDAAAFLACDGAGNAVGYLVAKLRDLDPSPFHHRRCFLEIDQIAVDPAHRRAGLGHALVEAAREEARQRGADAVHLATWAFNQGAQAFFEREGFLVRAVQLWQPV